MPADSFFDSNIIIYSVAEDGPKESASRALLSGGGTVSVQVLNEVVNVLRRKRGWTWQDIHDLLAQLRIVLDPVPLSLAAHQQGLVIAERYKLQVYDAMILAAALEAECGTLWSEDMQDGMVVNGRLTIRNPFG